jgi:hypothetical protein
MKKAPIYELEYALCSIGCHSDALLVTIGSMVVIQLLSNGAGFRSEALMQKERPIAANGGIFELVNHTVLSFIEEECDGEEEI